MEIWSKSPGMCFEDVLEDAQNEAFKEGRDSPKIKQLEWTYDDKFFIWEAKSVFGEYVFVDSLLPNKKLFFRGKKIAIVLTIKEAKEAAQADFEKRVKECLA